MDILVVGGGGREHAILDCLRKSPRCGKLYAAPGNGGIAAIAQCLPVKATDIDGVVRAARELSVGLVFVAPDDPLVLGMVDALEAAGIRAFGPRANAAIIEGSKVFSKDLMKKYGIPTASSEVFDDADKALEYIKAQDKYPVVIKADGLALGKGVIIPSDYEGAVTAITTIMTDKAFGKSGDRVVIEEYLTGPEVSVLAFCDGRTVVPMVSAQDHKRAYDRDEGPNTGGMGAFSPSRVYTDEIAAVCMERIFIPTVDALRTEGRPFKGVIYFGLMLTPDGPKVIEYNARFGDPEAQAVLPRLKTDLIDIIDAVIGEKLDKISIEWDKSPSVCVVMASGGYPGKYETGYEITGLDVLDGVTVYHAGTAARDGKILTAGGRVLGVCAKGEHFGEAIQKAYGAVEQIKFKDAHYRRDIGIK